MQMDLPVLSPTTLHNPDLVRFWTVQSLHLLKTWDKAAYYREVMRAG